LRCCSVPAQLLGGPPVNGAIVHHKIIALQRREPMQDISRRAGRERQLLVRRERGRAAPSRSPGSGRGWVRERPYRCQHVDCADAVVQVERSPEIRIALSMRAAGREISTS
jgi:hypothetical protein